LHHQAATLKPDLASTRARNRIYSLPRSFVVIVDVIVDVDVVVDDVVVMTKKCTYSNLTQLEGNSPVCAIYTV